MPWDGSSNLSMTWADAVSDLTHPEWPPPEDWGLLGIDYHTSSLFVLGPDVVWARHIELGEPDEEDCGGIEEVECEPQAGPIRADCRRLVPLNALMPIGSAQLSETG
jgi:hypothetical protein